MLRHMRAASSGYCTNIQHFNIMATKSTEKRMDASTAKSALSGEKAKALQAALAQNAGQPVAVTVARGTERLTLTATPRLNPEAGRYLLGIRVRDSVRVRYPFPSCFAKASRLSRLCAGRKASQ